MAANRIEDALKQLDSTDQALLDLSLHRGFDDQLLASLVDGDVSDVEARRDAALDKLARIAAVNGDGAREQVRAELRSLSEAGWIEPSSFPRRRRRTPMVVAGAIVVAAGVATAIALLAGGGGSTTSKPVAGSVSTHGAAAAPPQTSPVPRNHGGVPLEPLSPTTRGRVVASIRVSNAARRLTLKLRGLAAPRRGAYELWLYNSVLDSRPLGSLSAGAGSIAARLPSGAPKYRWLDLTIQPGADRVHHSGESRFRVPLSRVLARGPGAG